MSHTEAINKSSKGTAVRVEIQGRIKTTTIKYKYGSGFILVTENGRVDFKNSRKATAAELDGFSDWEPSEVFTQNERMK